MEVVARSVMPDLQLGTLCLTFKNITLLYLLLDASFSHY